MRDAAKTKQQLVAELEVLRGELDTLRQQVGGDDVSAVKRRLAVERVRAEAMAMRSSDDLLKVVGVMFQALLDLGFDTGTCWIDFSYKETGQFIAYQAFLNPRKAGATWASPDVVEISEEVVAATRNLSMQKVQLTQRYFPQGQGWSKEPIAAEKIAAWAKRVAEPYGLDTIWPSTVADGFIVNVQFEHGWIGMIESSFSEEHIVVLKEFTEALSLGYLRYLDFQQLEETHRKLQETQAQMIVELEKELQKAHELQMALMPKEAPRVAGFKFAGQCVTANHVGGDFFKYYRLPQGYFLGILADVTGHAMEAAVPMLMFSGILESQVELGGTIEELFGRLNRSLHRTLPAHTFVCLVMGELDPSTRLFRFSNSGCPYPYHYKAASGEVTELQVDAYPLGVRPDTVYRVIEIQLEPGDWVIFCSDGIIEAVNGEGEMFGFERTAETIRRGCIENLSAEALLERIMGEVKGFRGETPQGDDQTVVVLKVEKQDGGDHA